MTPLYLLLILEIVILNISLLLCGKDILNPANVFVFVFTFSIVIATMFVNNWKLVNTYHWEAMGIILSGSLLFVMVDFWVREGVKGKKFLYYNKGRDELYISNYKILLINALDLFILLLAYRYIKGIVGAYGSGASSFGSLGSTFRSVYGHSNEVSASDQMSSFLRYAIYLLQSSAYVTLYPFVNNVFIKKDGFRRNILYLLPSIIFVVYGILCGSRGDMLKIVISGFAIFYILFLKNNGWKNKNIGGIIRRGIKTIVAALLAFFGMSILVGRSAVGNSTVLNSLFMQIAGYAGAPIVHFSQYFDKPVSTITPGEECFTNLYEFLQSHGFSGINAVKHLEYNRLVGGIYGNVYTFFRRPLHDFGIVGMYVYLLLFAVFICAFYYRFIKYANYRSKDLFGILLIIYSNLFQWVAYASIDQISGEFISPSFLFRVFAIILIYLFLYNFDIKRLKITIL